MVELMVTIVIGLILLGVVTMSIMAYTDYADFKRQNEYAQSLFVAAQNSLTHYSENGELEAIDEVTEKFALCLKSSMLTGDAQTQFLSNTNKANRIFSITINKDGTVCGKNGLLTAGSTEETQLKKIFSQIFSDYVYDKSILSGASVTIEFDPLGGEVYSVLYSDKKAGFYYSGSSLEGENKEKYVSLSDRDYDVRKKLMLGYYGIGDISGITSRTKEKPVIESVKLVNSKALSLQFKLTDKYAAATSALDYTVDIYSASTGKKLMSVAVDDINAIEKSEGVNYALGDSVLTRPYKVTFYEQDGTTESGSDTYTFICYADNDNTVHLYLDLVDLAAEQGKETSDIKNTYSISRFGIDEILESADSRVTKNIYVNVSGGGGKYKTTAWKRSNTENMYFASENLSGTSKNYTEAYTISNARHLYNVRYEEEKYGGSANGVTGIKYTVTSSFAWSGEGGILSTDLGSMVFDAMVQQENESTAFPSIAQLFTAHTMTSSSAKNVISGLILSSEKENLGLFSVNCGNIEKLKLSDLNVQGGNSVGSFCGLNKGTLKELTATSGTVTGKQNVGGIFGKNAIDSDTVFSNLTNGCEVSGSKYVGGIVGQADDKATLANCSNTGFVRGIITSDQNPTQTVKDETTGLMDDFAAANPGTNFNMDDGSWALQQPGNIYNFYTQLLNEKYAGDYPAMSDYDRAAVKEIVNYIVANSGNSNITSEANAIMNGYKSVDELCDSLRWTICSVIDSNGSYVGNNGQKYSIFLVAKTADRIGNTSDQNAWFAFRDGVYYYYQYYNASYLPNNGKLTTKAFTNKMMTVDANGEIGGGEWKKYEPEFSLGSAEPEKSDDENTTTLKNEPSYIGGISGYVNGSNVVDCTSSPQVDEEKIASLLSENEAFSGESGSGMPLLGAYVGGIVGFSDAGSSISGCYTSGGYVVGSHYVGGIVGYNNGGAIAGGETNRANVVGNYYAGGVTGANAKAAGKDANGFFIVDGKYSTDISVSGWTNMGLVIAAKSYAGGITGYNSCIIKDCGSDFEITLSQKELAKKYGGDYCGGIAGYNNGKITAGGNGINITSFAAGKNYVGGVIGFNDSGDSCLVEGYSYSGGYIQGVNFVGGFIGANLSANIFNEQEIKSNPNSVEGLYAVGGVIGGNAVKADKDINITFNTNNFLGTIKAKAFAGGYIGCNILTDSAADALKFVKLIEKFDEATSVQTAVETLKSGEKNINSTKTLLISGKDSGNSSNKFGGITAQVFVGGVIGYNAEKTAVNISKIVNKSPITATSSIETQELNGDDNIDINGKAKKYSYAGGIIGKCTERMTISDCSADDTGRVVTMGTYTGGLVEVNEGTVENCTAGNIGNSSMSYVGGIVGLNKSQGEILNPRLDGKTVIGNNMVGGIASDNYGLIDGGKNKSEIEGAVIGYGSNVGGIAAFSHKGTAEVKNFLLMVSVNRKITAGINVGGAVGNNEAAISAISFDSKKNKYYVEGNTNVGGIIGLHNSDSAIKSVENYAAITGQYGYIGGIIGNVTVSAEISGCKNFGDVQVISSKKNTDSAAAGITANLQGGKITDCANSGNIDAIKGYAGGICAINRGTVSGCSTGDKAMVTGNSSVGGIVAKNDGTIVSSDVSGITVTNRSTSTGSKLGAIAGQNNGSVKSCNVKSSSVISAASNVNAGGVAGTNGGIIDGGSNGSTVSGTTVCFADYSMNYFGNLGGIAGVNTKNIANYTLSECRVLGAANNPAKVPTFDPNYDFEANGAEVYGYGGIAGINGSSKQESLGALIENCTVAASDIRGIGDSNNVANIGGVAGVNGLGCMVKKITYTGQTTVISTSDKNKTAYSDASGYAHIGGAVGYNYGSLSAIGKQRASGFSDVSNDAAKVASADASSTVNVFTKYGHIGGMIGYNRSSGYAEYCATGKNWSVYATTMATDNGTGGIIGYNASPKKLLSCDNWGSVKKPLTSNSSGTGGIIGRNEVTTGTWYLSGCYNFGLVNGARIGGMIGVVKYNGGILENCYNYGAVSNTDGNEAAGGIVGDLYEITKDGIVNFKSCGNFGTVDGKAAAFGGILGRINNNTGKAITVNLADCVNTGKIAAGTSAGIVSKDAADATSKVYIQNCRNYYLASSVSGIYGTGSAASHTTISNCFGVAGISGSSSGTPITSASIGSASTNNYYFTDKAWGTSLSYKGTPVYLVKSGSVYNGYTADSKTVPVIQNLSFGGETFSSFMSDSATGLAALGDTQNSRQVTYLKIDEKLKIKGQDTLTAPTGITVKDIGGSMRVSWTSSGGYSYDVVMKTTKKDGTQATIAQTVFSTAFDITYSELDALLLGGKISEITITAHPFVGDTVKTGNNSAVDFTIPEQVLSAPKIRLVLDSVSPISYKIMVDNLDDYLGCGNVDINVTANTATVKVSLADGKMVGVYKVSAATNSNTTVTAYAQSADTATVYGRSGASVRETKIPTADMYLNSGLSTVSDKGYFSGKTPEELAYNLKLSMAGKYTLFNRVEFVARDVTGLNVPVVYAYNTAKTSEVGTTDTWSLINNLPVDLNAQITSGGETIRKYQNVCLRTYPYAVTNEIVFTGYDVGSYSLAQLQDMMKEKQLPFSDGKNLDDGYVLYLQADGSYKLEYNTLVYSYEKDSPVPAKDGSYLVSKSTHVTVIHDIISASSSFEPTPQILASYNDETGSYLAYWDASINGEEYKSKYSGTYNFSLIGITKDGAEVEIKSGQVTAQENKNGSNYLSFDNTDDWNYKEVRLTVDHLGTEDGSGKTTKFGSTATLATATKLKLPQQTAPNVALVSKNDLVYKVSWSGIPKDSEYYSELGGYRVTVIADILTDDVSNPTKRISAKYIIDDPDTLETQVDFEALTGTADDGKTYTGSAVTGNDVSVSIVAAAKKGAGQTIYADSIEGVAYTFDLPTRLSTPQIADKLTVTPGADEAVSIDNFNETGFTVTYDGTSSYDSADFGKYELAVSVFDKENKEHVLYGKGEDNDSAPLTMSGTKIAETVTAVLNKTKGLNADYSDCRLSISIRAVSDSRISSDWSAYKDFTLPKATVESVNMENAIGTTETECTAYISNGSDYSDAGGTLNVPQDSFNWSLSEYVNGYDIKLTQAEKVDNKEIVDKIGLSFVKNGTTGRLEPQVTYLNPTDESITSTAGTELSRSNTASELNKNNHTDIWEFSISDRDQYVKIIDKDGNNLSSLSVKLSEKMTVTIEYEDDNKTVRSIDCLLVLPDAVVPKFPEIAASVSTVNASVSTVTITSKPESSYYNEAYSICTRDANNKFTAELTEAQKGILFAKQMNAYLLQLKAVRARTPAVTDAIVVQRVPDITPTATPKPSSSPEPSATPEPTERPTVEPSPSPSESPSPEPSPTQTPSLSPEPSPSTEPSVSPEPTEEPLPDSSESD